MLILNTILFVNIVYFYNEQEKTLKKISTSIYIIIGLAFGLFVPYFTMNLVAMFTPFNPFTSINIIGLITIYVLSGLLFVSIFLSVSSSISRGIKKIGKSLEGLFLNISTVDLFFGIVGLIVGLVISILLSGLYGMIPILTIQIVLSVVTYVVFIYLGVAIAVRRKNDILNFLKNNKKPEAKNEEKKKSKYTNPKILDTSVIIDGRIQKVIKSGFLEGDIIVCDLVLNELRHIADEGQVSKRERGRRGLDIIKEIQEACDKRVFVLSTGGKYKDIEETDEKLVFIAREYGGKIVTNDYNLNKMALVHKVGVLNINQLAKELKSNVLTGERLNVNVIKEGKEKEQGVAYFDDGTMVVVEKAGHLVGQYIEIEITSVIQTASGRMIFAIAV